MWQWFGRATYGASHGAAQGGYGDQQSWLQLPDVPSVVIVAVALSALAAWLYHRRYADIWLLLGITSIVARLYVYHRPYDDLLLLVPPIALLRVAGSQPLANWLLLAALPPLRLPVETSLVAGWVEQVGIIHRTLTWVAMLIFLLWLTWRDERVVKHRHPVGRVSNPAVLTD